MNGKYVYSESGEWFVSDEYDTKEECIRNGFQEYPDEFYIGITKDIKIKTYIADDIINGIAENIYNECGLESFEGVDRKSKDKLNDMLWDTFMKWTEEEKENLDYYQVVDIEKISKKESD